MQKMLTRAAIALSLAVTLAGTALAQAAYQQAPSIELARAETRWRVNESWNNDDLIYTFQTNGVFRSASGASGRWVQTGSRVVLDWPSYGAVYVGVMNGDRVSGTALMDDGTVVGSFILTRER